MDYVDKKLLMSAAENFGVEINAEQAEKFEGYARLLFEWNQKMNLTAITSPEGVALLHSDAAFGGGFQRGRFPCGRGHGGGISVGSPCHNAAGYAVYPCRQPE